MAVYTEVPAAALATFLQDYDLGRTLAFEGIAGGVENTNYMLETTEGRFILTLYEKRVAEADLPFFIGLMDHLASSGFPCPKPVRRKDGAALGRLEGRAAAIVTFLEGGEAKCPPKDVVRQAGAAMARLHLAARDFAIARPNALAPSGWPQLAKTAVPRADEVEPGLADLIATELEWLGDRWPDNLPQGVIHADWFRDNVFFKEGRLTGVIDFYFACNDALVYDIAIAINAWGFDARDVFQPEVTASFVAGYESVRRLSRSEKLALPVLCRGAALRFLLTRTNDFLNVPDGALVTPHDPTVFSRRLRFHRSVAGPATYGADV